MNPSQTNAGHSRWLGMFFGVSLCVWLQACSTTPTMPDGVGQGLMRADASAPAGVVSYPRPQWAMGSEQIYLRGGTQQIRFTVERADGEGYVLRDEESGMRLVRDLDLAYVSEIPKDWEVPAHALAPRDVRYHWPLWVGKRWTCSFVDKTVNGTALALVVDYEVEAEDTVRVPAGEFPCLRITRRARVDGESRFYERHSMVWYAPELGMDVRQLSGGMFVELQQVPVKGTP